jgi:hypothetical protein
MIPPLLEEIFSTRTVYDKDGNAYSLHSETPIDEIKFLISLLKQIEARRCLEIGLCLRHIHTRDLRCDQRLRGSRDVFDRSGPDQMARYWA